MCEEAENNNNALLKEDEDDGRTDDMLSLDDDSPQTAGESNEELEDSMLPASSFASTMEETGARSGQRMENNRGEDGSGERNGNKKSAREGESRKKEQRKQINVGNQERRIEELETAIINNMKEQRKQIDLGKLERRIEKMIAKINDMIDRDGINDMIRIGIGSGLSELKESYEASLELVQTSQAEIRADIVRMQRPSLAKRCCRFFCCLFFLCFLAASIVVGYAAYKGPVEDYDVLLRYHSLTQQNSLKCLENGEKPAKDEDMLGEILECW